MSVVVTYAMVVGLVVLSGIMSGLSLGLMSLDLNQLEILIKGGSEKDRLAAMKIFPIRKDGNWLLSTLLMSNVVVNAGMSVLLADIAGGTVGFLASSGAILVFGEIVPQALCARHGLKIGAVAAPFVRLIMLVTSPLSWTISKALDVIFGEELGTFYTRSELTTMLSLHERTGKISSDENLILSGALTFGDKAVNDVMTPLDTVYMLDDSLIMDYELLQEVVKAGFSRIPVYTDTRENVTGLLLVKDLALLTPEDEMPLSLVMEVFRRPVLTVFDDTMLPVMLNEFKQGKSHLAIVRTVVYEDGKDPRYVTCGVASLEDVFEEIIRSEIVDETDQYVDNRREVLSTVRENLKYDKIVNHRRAVPRLEKHQVSAVTSFLSSHCDPFHPNLLSPEALRRIIADARVVTVEPGQITNQDNKALYSRGNAMTAFTLVLQGSLAVVAGADEIRSSIGPFSYLGTDALLEESPIATFSASIPERVQLIQVSRRVYNFARKLKAAGPDGTAVVDDESSLPEQDRNTIEILQNMNNTSSNTAGETVAPGALGAGRVGSRARSTSFGTEVTNKPTRARSGSKLVVQQPTEGHTSGDESDGPKKHQKQVVTSYVGGKPSRFKKSRKNKHQKLLDEPIELELAAAATLSSDSEDTIVKEVKDIDGSTVVVTVTEQGMDENSDPPGVAVIDESDDEASANLGRPTDAVSSDSEDDESAPML